MLAVLDGWGVQERDHRVAATVLELHVELPGVTALIRGARLGGKPASAQFVDQGEIAKHSPSKRSGKLSDEKPARLTSRAEMRQIQRRGRLPKAVRERLVEAARSDEPGEPLSSPRRRRSASRHPEREPTTGSTKCHRRRDPWWAGRRPK
jgi:hypothetical protein